jgi:MYXO-CTERM domain-containing protein
MKQSLFGLVATIGLIGATQAAVLVDNFESYSSVGDDMAGKGNWQVSNGTPAVPSEGAVVILDSYTWDGSLQSATVGGVAQTTLGLTSLFNNTVSVSLGAPTVFVVETAYTESTEGFRNNFQFVLGSNAGSLLTLDFTPDALGVYAISWSSAFAAGGVIGTVNANTSTQFQLNTSWNGSNVLFGLSNAGSPIASGTFAGLSNTNVINGFAVNWNSNSNGGLGNNSITVDNVSVVPETSSALLGLVGAAFALRRRRA